MLKKCMRLIVNSSFHFLFTSIITFIKKYHVDVIQTQIEKNILARSPNLRNLIDCCGIFGHSFLLLGDCRLRSYKGLGKHLCKEDPSEPYCINSRPTVTPQRTRLTCILPLLAWNYVPFILLVLIQWGSPKILIILASNLQASGDLGAKWRKHLGCQTSRKGVPNLSHLCGFYTVPKYPIYFNFNWLLQDLLKIFFSYPDVLFWFVNWISIISARIIS